MALKPMGRVTQSANRGISGPTKCTLVQQKKTTTYALIIITSYHMKTFRGQRYNICNKLNLDICNSMANVF